MFKVVELKLPLTLAIRQGNMHGRGNKVVKFPGMFGTLGPKKQMN